MAFVDSGFVSEQEVLVSKISVLSGVREAGRTVKNSQNGRSTNGLFYVWTGEAQFFPQDGEPLVAKNGELLILPKKCRYTMKYMAPQTTFVLLNFELFSDRREPIILSNRICKIGEDRADNRFANIMAKFELCSASENQSAVFRRKELIYRLFSMLAADTVTFDAEERCSSTILAGVQLLQQTYLENLPIGNFARACKISESLFRSLFVKQFGMSPVQYRNRLRMERARSILIDGNSTVSEAAYASGFDNIGYFCRYYKKTMGETPRQTQLRNR